MKGELQSLAKVRSGKLSHAQQSSIAGNKSTTNQRGIIIKPFSKALTLRQEERPFFYKVYYLSWHKEGSSSPSIPEEEHKGSFFLRVVGLRPMPIVG